MKKFFILICAAMIFFAGCSSEPPVEVKVEKVLYADRNLTLTHEGKISLSNELKIFSNVSGNVIEKYFKDGDYVTEGQPLFKVGNHEDEAELLQAKADLSKAMTDLAKASAQKDSVNERQAEIAELQERIQALEEKTKSGIIYAPINDKAVANSKLGEEVTANETILATIGRDNPVIVRFETSDEEKNFLSLSEPKVSLRLSDDTIYPRAGKIILDGSTVEASFDNPDGHLTLGDTVQIELDDVTVPNVMLVPANAVRQRDGADVVFVVDSNKKAALKKISLGGKVNDFFIVNDGLKAGDLVVVEGMTNLHEGTPLKSN